MFRTKSRELRIDNDLSNGNSSHHHNHKNSFEFHDRRQSSEHHFQDDSMEQMKESILSEDELPEEGRTRTFVNNFLLGNQISNSNPKGSANNFNSASLVYRRRPHRNINKDSDGADADADKSFQERQYEVRRGEYEVYFKNAGYASKFWISMIEKSGAMQFRNAMQIMLEVFVIFETLLLSIVPIELNINDNTLDEDRNRMLLNVYGYVVGVLLCLSIATILVSILLFVEIAFFDESELLESFAIPFGWALSVPITGVLLSCVAILVAFGLRLYLNTTYSFSVFIAFTVCAAVLGIPLAIFYMCVDRKVRNVRMGSLKNYITNTNRTTVIN
eukprot:m.18741 g.18741  ORF g.18741 m.18741 type:complete len:331 (-) comp8355_c0_seq1:9-1001(-)